MFIFPMWRFRAPCLNISVAGEKHSLVLLFILKRHTASLLPHLVIVIAVKHLPMLMPMILLLNGKNVYFFKAYTHMYMCIHIHRANSTVWLSINVYHYLFWSHKVCGSLLLSEYLLQLFLQPFPQPPSLSSWIQFKWLSMVILQLNIRYTIYNERNYSFMTLREYKTGKTPF